MHHLDTQFEVFYDGECPLCRKEIEMIRGKDKHNSLCLTDISVDGFQLEGYSHETLMREIHGRRPDGSFVTGVEVFREIYDRIGFSSFVAPTRLPVISHMFDLGYWFFAKLRFAHAMRRAKKKSRKLCDAACDPKSIERPHEHSGKVVQE